MGLLKKHEYLISSENDKLISKMCALLDNARCLNMQTHMLWAWDH